MSTAPIFMKPVFQERIWGGTQLKERFNYEIPGETVGECWAISAHPNGTSLVASGEYEGRRLCELWEHHRTLFGGIEGTSFPLLTKILDANQDLSVQVHPDDEKARLLENGEFGKTECWYIIDCGEDAEIIYGHTAQSKEQLLDMIENHYWSDLLKRVKIKPGDFFFVPSGTIHALCKGALVLETQQSCDITYRVYDYDRTDPTGAKRELHLEKALEVTSVPHQDGACEPITIQTGDVTITTFVQDTYFTVHKWEISGEASFSQGHPFMQASVIKGSGSMRHNGTEYPLELGAHFILPAEMGSFTIVGEMELIVSHV
ncbi:mannose-6-phosphate isomerase, class I [Bacillus sp. FJAT-42376]|uniref:mannose-6-phosphate isomerase, class I n=1 Tax=Bacillus sp. FJAT-42376 TaxID=2014076 RepID=UPI000F4FA680|nr:mannose-6-phosphate isomerase, class I [Bacillus sp. FJAT-42376]AZB44659.1 mannose-6-phosphate isomerase, class I [Bacillus sp. FJAT-42376]